MACRYFSTPFVSLLGSLNLEGTVLPGFGKGSVNHGSIENELNGMTVSRGSLISSRSAHSPCWGPSLPRRFVARRPVDSLNVVSTERSPRLTRDDFFPSTDPSPRLYPPHEHHWISFHMKLLETFPRRYAFRLIAAWFSRCSAEGITAVLVPSFRVHAPNWPKSFGCWSKGPQES
jgi:hypothetical protein